MANGQQSAKTAEDGNRRPDPLIGRVIADRFKITSLIARGGMGKVYRAEQAPLGRLCAIKVLNPNYSGDADPEFHRRFFREASITSKITHPNSVTIFDYGKTEDDIYFMAMEYLEGKTLHQALRENGVIHEMRAGRIAAQICRALREAHKLGVIHRDLKPANIFLTRPTSHVPATGSAPPMSEEDEDFVKVLDFGLVKHLTERPEEQLTQTGLFMGSPKYMAPEQIQGGHVDERTDIYSLGIMMYEMLAGKVPFERASSVNILMAHVGEPPPPMRAVNPNLVCSPAFEEIVMACIAKNPNERFSSMEQVLQAIRRAHGGTMTGQIAALTSEQIAAINSTGQLMAVRTVPPPPVAVIPASSLAPSEASPQYPRPPSLGSSAAGVMAAASLPIDVVDGSNVLASGEIELQPRSKLWLAVGVLVAAVLGGALGMLAFRWTSPDASASKAAAQVAAPPPAAVPAPPVAAAPVASAAPVAAPAVPKEEPTRFQVTTEPAGATVFEDGKELCSPTPCDLRFDDQDPSMTHRLRIVRSGHQEAVRSVRASEGSLLVKLPRVIPRNVVPAPKADAPAEGEETPNGFKAQPY